MPTIRIVTDVPGPKAQAILERRNVVVPRGVTHATRLVAASAQGAVVDDVDGNRFIDLASGIGTLNIGHADPGVVAAINAQAGKLIHMAFQVSPYEGYIELAERLALLTPGTFPKKVLFANTGAEAVENALKIVRHATKRPGILCFEDSFHGRTMGALAVTSKVNYKAGMGPLDPNVWRVPYGYCYRCSLRLTYPQCGVMCVAEHLEKYFARYVDPRQIAAVIVEPILGEGGFVVPPPDFFDQLTATCRQHGILLIADEVQTGIGRTGRMFACEHFGFVPDIVLAAKSLAGGIPLAAVIGRAELMDSPDPGGLGSTFGGNPLALAAAAAVLDRIESDELLDRAERIGERIQATAVGWMQKYPTVGDVRRLGAMVGVEFVRDRITREPAGKLVSELITLAYKTGVIALNAGTYGNVLRFLPPLVITDEQLSEALDVLTRCVEVAEGEAGVGEFPELLSIV